MQSLESLTEYVICQSQCGICFSVYEYDKDTHIYMHLLMVLSRDPPNWHVTAVSPADQWELRNAGRGCCRAVDEDN
jgi:hypothetical protein